MDRKPIVLDSSGQLQQLQNPEELDIPLEQRVQALQCDFQSLCCWLLSQGFELPEDLIAKSL